MRFQLAFAVLVSLLVACGGRQAVPADPQPAPPPEASAATPAPAQPSTEAELAAEAQRRESCVNECVRARSMEAVSIDVIEAGCAQRCDAEFPNRGATAAPNPLAPIDLE